MESLLIGFRRSKGLFLVAGLRAGSSKNTSPIAAKLARMATNHIPSRQSPKLVERAIPNGAPIAVEALSPAVIKDNERAQYSCATIAVAAAPAIGIYKAQPKPAKARPAIISSRSEDAADRICPTARTAIPKIRIGL